MDRTEFLKLCQRASVLEDGICGTKKDVPKELTVKFDGRKYYPVAYQLCFEKGNTVHKAILHELNVNSVVVADLNKVEVFNT